MDIYIALAHYPVTNKQGELVATAVTNLDIHDLARTARTYGVAGYYIVTPVAQQRSLASRIVSHWREGEGQKYNPIRAKAFELVQVTTSIEDTVKDIQTRSGVRPLTVVTGANLKDNCLTYEALRQQIADDPGACLVIFGTGWGLTPDFIESCDVKLPALRCGRPQHDGYNHLSVRAAVAIVLDRLLGERDALTPTGRT